jgi:hypothetical protein
MIEVSTLRAAGLTDEQIVRVFEAEQDGKIARRREQMRAASKTYRERHQNRDDGDDEDDASLSSLTKSNLESKEEKKERKRPATIPPDWQPSPRTVAIALGYGFTESEINETAEDLRLWAQSNAHRSVARKSDWDATLLTWLRKKRKVRDEADRNRKPTMADALGKLREAEESIRRGDGGVFPTWPPPLRVISNG